MRTRLGVVVGLTAVVAGTSVGAATLHRYAVTSATGSGGATTFLQSSASGSALQGQVASNVQTAIKIPFGVLGEYDAMGSTFGSGVLGISTTGYGVGAESLSESQPSLLGLNSSGGPAAQVFGTGGGDAIDAEATGGGAGVYATSDSVSAISAYGMASGYATVYGEDDASSASYGIYGNSNSQGGIGASGVSNNGGVGLFGYSNSDSQGLPALQTYTDTDGTELFDAGVADANTAGNLSISTVLSSVSANASGLVPMTGVASSDLQINGDIYVSGAIFTDCSTGVPYATNASGCGNSVSDAVPAKSGTEYKMYASSQASKTVEDAGEAVLRGGSAHVVLDPSFASVISSREPYLVFTTPQGDTRGLYVTNRTPSGFDVRETQGGHGTLTFDYRIVAHPYGAGVARMTAIAPRSQTRRSSGFPVKSRALAMHEAMLAHMHALAAKHRAFHMRPIPASLVSAAGFTTR